MMSNIGKGADSVKLVFNGKDSRIFTNYTVRKSILTQPSKFSVKLGWGKTVGELITKIPPRTPFKLYIHDAPQFSGETDGYQCGGFASEITITGRDYMARVHDGYLTSEVAFKDATYAALAGKVLTAVGLGDRELLSSNDANRKLTTGVGIPDVTTPTTVDTIELDKVEIGATTPGVSRATATVKRSIQAQLGESYLEFLMRQLRRAGLFIWSTGDGNFVLSEPNSNQKPVARILKRRGRLNNMPVSATASTFSNDTTNRYSQAIVYGRGGGRKFGRSKARGAFVDEEMINLGYDRPIAFRDVNVSTLEQAEFYARRKLSEYARAGWQLSYTIPGHTTPSLITGQPCVWQPDTMVEVIDDEFGLKGLYYVEECVYSRPPTTTTLTLMRPQNLIFRNDVDS